MKYFSIGMNTPEVIAYTSIVGSSDFLREDQHVDGAHFVAFVDKPWGSCVWREEPAYNRCVSPRRNEWAAKILAHQFVGTAKFSVWMASHVASTGPIADLARIWLEDEDLAVFQRPRQRCTYIEAEVCAQRGLDDPALIEQQVSRYKNAGLQNFLGLADTSILFRRHSPKVDEFNDTWWSELCRYSVRDQLSFMYALLKTELRVRWIPFKERKHHFDCVQRDTNY